MDDKQRLILVYELLGGARTLIEQMDLHWPGREEYEKDLRRAEGDAEQQLSRHYPGWHWTQKLGATLREVPRLEPQIRNLIFNWSQREGPLDRDEVVRLLREAVGLKDGERP